MNDRSPVPLEEGARPDDHREARLADVELLQDISSRMLRTQDARSLYEMIVDAASALMDSDFSSMQMLYPERGKAGELQLLAFRGFNPQAAKFWEWVRADSNCTCGVALATGKRVVEPDTANPSIVSGADQETYVQTGIGAVQSTPLFARDGRLVGMISTHWRKPHRPTERSLRLLDILARQAADLIERQRSEEALREAGRRKDEFLALLSHELRNPLAPIRNAVTLLQEVDDAETRREACAILDRQVAQLTRLVDGLLDLTRITRGDIEMRKTQTDLAAIVDSAVESSRPLIDAGGHRLDIVLPGAPIGVFADPLRMAQVVSNLLNNAAKYTPRGGRIGVSAHATRETASISVRDSGIGIPADELSRIFTMFTRLEGARQQAPGGLGVGLALSRQLVELHDGTIEARSAGPGQGSEFIVRFPLASSS